MRFARDELTGLVFVPFLHPVGKPVRRIRAHNESA
jgi:hypothetical protein